MLRSRLIPLYSYPDDWHTFLYKASKGSDDAVETLVYAHKAYMAAFTGVPDSPDTMPMDEYNAKLRRDFPLNCPVNSVQELHDLALNSGWIESSFSVSETPQNDSFSYVSLWEQQPVEKYSLMNDAMLHCIEQWSAEHFIHCARQHGLEYDAREVTTGMLYISLTWPDWE